MDLILCLSTCAVNVFVLISGYFLSSKQARSLGKVFSLYFQVVLFSFIGYGITLYFREGIFNPLHAALILMPHNYFVLLYTALYLLSPFLNKYLLLISQKEYKKLLIIAFFLFSVYNTLVDLVADVSGREMIGRNTIGLWGTQYGYTIVNFILLYCIGGYLKRFGIPTLIKKRGFLMSAICVLILYCWRIIIPNGSSAASYCNPFVILLAVCILSIFEDVRLKNRFGLVVNELASGAFACYLFHIVIINRIGVKEYATGPILLFAVHFVLSIVAIYLVSYLLYKLYSLALSPLLRYFDRLYISNDDTPLFIKR